MSIVLQVAERAGRHSRRQKRYFYSIARGSASEVAAIMDVLRLRRLAPAQDCARVRSLAVRVVQLLTKLHAALVLGTSITTQRGPIASSLLTSRAQKYGTIIRKGPVCSVPRVT